MVDAGDLKSSARKSLRVRVPPPVLTLRGLIRKARVGFVRAGCATSIPVGDRNPPTYSEAEREGRESFRYVAMYHLIQFQ